MPKPKKYAAVVADLPQLPGVAPERREVVDAVTSEILNPKPLADDEVQDKRTISERLNNVNQEIKWLTNLLKRATVGKSKASSLAHAYALCRATRERIDEWSSQIGVLVEAYQWLMVDAMNAEDLKSLTLANGQPISKWEEPYTKIADKEAFRVWCLTPQDVCTVCGGKEHLGHDESLKEFPHPFTPGGGLERKMSLQWNIANELCKAMLLEGHATIDEETGEVTPAPMPPGVTMWSQTKVRLGSEG